MEKEMELTLIVDVERNVIVDNIHTFRRNMTAFLR